ncbi:MAG: hypothetical protein ABIJ42_08930 [Acidobacteriota bacterium]
MTLFFPVLLACSISNMAATPVEGDTDLKEFRTFGAMGKEERLMEMRVKPTGGTIDD